MKLQEAQVAAGRELARETAYLRSCWEIGGELLECRWKSIELSFDLFDVVVQTTVYDVVEHPQPPEESTPAEAAAFYLERGDWFTRSCWECNPAHEHLRGSSGVLICFICDKRFCRGKEV